MLRATYHLESIAFWFGLGASAAILGCASGTGGATWDSAVDASAHRMVLSAQLVDSVVWYDESGMGPSIGARFRVEVTTDNGVDTVPNVLTIVPPVVFADSFTVVGIVHETQELVSGIFSYEVSSRRVQVTTRVGPGFDIFSLPRFSPDGRSLGYMGADRNYHLWAVAVSWPTLEVVVEGPLIETNCTEPWGNGTKWVGTDSLLVFMNLCLPSDSERGWARARISVSEKTCLVDSVSAEVVRRAFR